MITKSSKKYYRYLYYLFNFIGFIKAGRNSASIEIVLRNAGPSGYQQKVFGDEITVIRQFSGSGSSSYKIKSASGMLIKIQYIFYYF